MRAIVSIQERRISKARINRKKCGAPWDSLVSIKQKLRGEKIFLESRVKGVQ